jgi:hypothetical protein
MKFKIILLSISLLLFPSCSKELDISEFSDDFNNYTTELKIEAVILPTENTAIVRVDRSVLINETELYNCVDDDGDWDIEDDVGSDGIDSIEEGIPVDSNGTEGNGQPDCGEPHVDEYDEILPQIHIYEQGIDSCIVEITHSETNSSCTFNFNETAGNFFYTDDKQKIAEDMDNIETVFYGAYVPSDACDGFDWKDDEGEYELSISCTSFPEYGNITSKEPIQIARPVIFYNKEDYELIKKCDNYACLENYDYETISDTLYFAEDAPDENAPEQYIYYSSLLESSYYQVAQYHLDKTSGEYKITHEHPDQATDIENVWGNICLMTEKVMTQIFDGNNDEIDFEANISKYELFTFNESFTNYYFFDLLDILDPVRTNLRDGNGNPMMGTFGALTSNEIILRIIDCSQFETEENCSGTDAHQVCEWNTSNAKCGIKNSGPPQD